MSKKQKLKLSDKIIHITASQEWLSNPKNIKFINKLVETAYVTTTVRK